jgi:hypothetical protein
MRRTSQDFVRLKFGQEAGVNQLPGALPNRAAGPTADQAIYLACTEQTHLKKIG